MFGLLSGTFGGADHARRLHRFPLTEQTATDQAATVVDPRQARAVLEAAGLTPATRAAVAEAVALVALGRRPQTRAALARSTATEPAYAESWLRSLARQLN
jgi:hypothetical protein